VNGEHDWRVVAPENVGDDRRRPDDERNEGNAPVHRRPEHQKVVRYAEKPLARENTRFGRGHRRRADDHLPGADPEADDLRPTRPTDPRAVGEFVTAVAATCAIGIHQATLGTFERHTTLRL